MPKLTDVLDHLRPFTFHGVDLPLHSGQQHGGACPFCGREGKFWVGLEGLWDCKVCGEKGNPLTFLRKLWGASDTSDEAALNELAADRGLLDPTTLTAWGVRLSVSNGDWVVPGLNAEGELWNLYRWLPDPATGKRRLLPTPGVHEDGKAHGVFGVCGGEPSTVVYWAEGPWDGMVLWETARREGMAAAVLASPGCNIFSPRWAPLFSGKDVVIFYDSDHPKRHCPSCKKAYSTVDHERYPSSAEGRGSAGVPSCPVCEAALQDPVVPPSGFAGVRRVCKVLFAAKKSTAPLSVSWLKWGPEGYDPERPNGLDVRDVLTSKGDPDERAVLLDTLLSMVEAVPSEWAAEAKEASVRTKPLPCRSWGELVNQLRIAFKSRRSVEDVLAVMLAVAASTMQVGEQLFLQVIGDAGTGKTRLCDGLLVSRYCYPLEHLTGFHSGWRGDGDGDYSLIARVNGKCMVTPEGDVLMSSPNFDQIMSQQRRIFDGTSGASYKNCKEDTRYTGLRTPWIMAGTPAMLDKDQTRLGDRFLKVFVDSPPEDDKRDILRRVGHSAFNAVVQTSNGEASSTVDEATFKFYQMTGGYVDWLREGMADKLTSVKADRAEVVERCADLAEFTADMRARPDNRRDRQESHNTKELPTRLMHQFVRLSACLAVALNRESIDEEVLRVTRKVALDTSYGIVRSVSRHLFEEGPEGVSLYSLTISTGMTEDKLLTLLKFMRGVRVCESFREKQGKHKTVRVRWRLTARVRELWQRVMVDTRR